jgi:hypothetical protein
LAVRRAFKLAWPYNFQISVAIVRFEERAPRKIKNYASVTPILCLSLKAKRETFAHCRERGDSSMIANSISIASIVATAAIASPALAQSRDHTGSMLPNYYRTNCQQEWGAWGPSPNAAFTPRRLYNAVGLTTGRPGTHRQQ